jgi:predicted transglutaminase-like cysteine proteinase
MITISIQPYTLRKAGLVGLILFCLSCLSAFAQSTYITVNSTPYDRQMTRIRPVLTSSADDKEQNVSLALVNTWMGNLRAIPYGFSTEWKTPDEVRLAPYADCKGKAVALYNAMHSRGATNIRLVIGKRAWTSRKTHAWLEWTTTNGTYILDPTINWSAFRAARAGRSSYIPLYAYAGSEKFRAAQGSAGLFASNGRRTRTAPASGLFSNNGLFASQHVASRL